MNCFLPGWNKKWNSIPHQYTSPAQGTVHHQSSVPGCGKLSDQSPGQGGSVRKCVSPEGLSSPSSISDNFPGFPGYTGRSRRQRRCLRYHLNKFFNLWL